MAKVKGDAALKKRLKSQAQEKGDLEMKGSGGAPIPPPPPPAMNFYMDRVVNQEEFETFAFSVFYGEGHSKAAEPNWIPTAVQSWAGGLVQKVSGERVCVGTTDMRIELLSPYTEFFQAIYTAWAPSANRRGDFKVWTPETWRIFRDSLRYHSGEPFIKPELRTKLRNEKTLHQITIDAGKVITGTRRVLPYRGVLVEKYGAFLNPWHFVHISPRDPAFIRFTPDAKAWERDIPVETTIAKYMRKYFPQLNDFQLREIADLHKINCLEDGVEFFTKLEDMVRVYRDGPAACMSKHDAHYGSHVHPLAPYVDMPGVKLAVMRTGGAVAGTQSYGARAFVVEKPDGTKNWIRIYGSPLLKTRLEARGYTPGNWRDMKVKKIPALDRDGAVIPETWVMPYIDDVNGNPDGENSQYAGTCESWDYWIVGSLPGITRALKADGHKKYTVLMATSSVGLIGVHSKYNPGQHRQYIALRDGVPYTPPGRHVFNQDGEIMCSGCQHIFQRPHVTPCLVSHDRAQPYWYCDPCLQNLKSSRQAFQLENEEPFQDGPAPLHAYFTETAGIPRSSDYVFLRGDKLQAKHVTAETHRFVAMDKLEDNGWVQLDGLYYGDQYLPVAEAVRYEGGWHAIKNLVADVFGKQIPKPASYFLGQNLDGQVQFFPRSPSIIREAITQGRFFIEGGKIFYDAKASFRPEFRRLAIQTMGECAEDEEDGSDEISTEAARTPLIEVLNPIWAFWNDRTGSMRDSRYHTIESLRNMFPRVPAEFLDACVNVLEGLKGDSFAGFDGITNLTPQLKELFRLARAPRDNAFYTPPAKKVRKPADIYMDLGTHNSYSTFTTTAI
jgi:hypothetical protein